MDPGTGRFRLTSARRRGPKSNPSLVGAIFAVLAAMVLVVIFADRDEPERPAALRTPVAAPPPSPTPSHTWTPAFERSQSGWVEAEIILPATPTSTPTMPTVRPAPTRRPRPTPAVSQCVVYRWSSSQVFTPSAQVKIDIRIDNRCPYDLGPNNLLFEITGWRQGDRIRSVRGIPFDTIRRGRSGELSVGLPGSQDWYDVIEVTARGGPDRGSD